MNISGVGRCFCMDGLQGHVLCVLWFAGVYARNHIFKLCQKIMGGLPPPPPPHPPPPTPPPPPPLPTPLMSKVYDALL